MPEQHDPLLAPAEMEIIQYVEKSSFGQDSLVKTNSAVDKPNLKQQLTDPTSNSNGDGSSVSCQQIVDQSLEKKASINEQPRQNVILEEVSRNETDEYMNSLPEVTINPHEYGPTSIDLFNEQESPEARGSDDIRQRASIRDS
jgi:hypothetical protein